VDAAATPPVAVVVVVELECSVLLAAAEEVSEDTDVVVEAEVFETVVEDVVELAVGIVTVLVFIIVLVLELEVVDDAELAALVKCNRLTLSSKQIPEVQGSLAQQPRKFPAEQTYHCFDPEQLVSSRGANASRSMLRAGPSRGEYSFEHGQRAERYNGM
jgi:hypothetical protein